MKKILRIFKIYRQILDMIKKTNILLERGLLKVATNIFILSATNTQSVPCHNTFFFFLKMCILHKYVTSQSMLVKKHV